jgi:Subtilisin inhibitor-like
MGMTSELKQSTTRALSRGALIAACGLAAAACGSTAAPSAGANGSGSSSAATTSAAKVSLTITQTGGSGTATKHWTLRCEPAGGSYPDPAAACAKLTKLRTIFNPTPGRHVMCPMIMADARTYIVYGTFLGQKVHQSIVDGGCTLARWNKLNQIFN